MEERDGGDWNEGLEERKSRIGKRTKRKLKIKDKKERERKIYIYR